MKNGCSPYVACSLSPATPVLDRPSPVLTPTRNRRFRPTRWGVFVLVLVVAGGGLVLLSRSGGGGRDLAPYTTTVEQGRLDGVITASGEVAAVRQVNLSPKQSGQLQELYVDEGDLVKAGEPIARMDPDDIEFKIAELEAQVQVRRVDLQRTRAEFERRQELHAAGAVNTDDYMRFQASYNSSKAQLQVAEQRLEQTKRDRDDLLVRAPFAGTITNRFADPGSFVTPTTSASATAGASSASIVQLASGLEVQAKVPESDIGRIQPGQNASVRVDAYPDQRFPARVSRVAPRAEKSNDVTTVKVELSLEGEQAKQLLRIGMTADIDFDTGKLAPKPLVPTVAIVTRQGQPGVLIPGKGDKPEFQAVSLGSSSGRQTQVLSGVEPGERIFLDLPPWAGKELQQD